MSSLVKTRCMYVSRHFTDYMYTQNQCLEILSLMHHSIGVGSVVSFYTLITECAQSSFFYGLGEA